MDAPKHSASELRAMLKEHKASMPRLSAKKSQLMEYAGKIGLFKAAAAPPSPPPEAVPEAQKKKSKPALPAVEVSVPKGLPAVLKKPEAKKSEVKAAPAPAKKSFSESAKGGLMAYTSFLAEGKARGMSHKEAVAAWKSRK